VTRVDAPARRLQASPVPDPRASSIERFDMRRMRSGFVVLWLASSGLAPLGATPECAAQVLVNEIVADPGRDWDANGAVDARDDEWIEIVNAGTTAVDLSGYRVSDGGTTVFRYGFDGTLAPGAVRLVRGSDSVAWEIANGVSTTGLSLNNAGDAVRLWHVDGADTTLADSYTYAGFEVLDDRSVGRMPDGGIEWRIFDAHNPYAGTTPPLGTGCLPTPGGANGCPTEVAPAAFSAVKRLYEPRAPSQ
jgi:hypothetical protein